MVINVHQLSSGLRKATLFFLTWPLLIFFGGFLRLPFAGLACAPLCAVLWREFRRPAERFDRRTFSVPSLLLAAVLPAVVLTFLSGAGGWGSGDSDWLKHDTLLRDLIARPWPVVYHTTHGPVLLVYYLAFYLPAALVGKLAGDSGQWVGGQVLALTTLVGTALSAMWLIVLGISRSGSANESPDDERIKRVGAPVWIGGAVFFGFSGLDVVGKMLVNLFLQLPAFYGHWDDIEWWAQFAQYSSNAATLFWAPQHAFGGWLPLALALDDWCSHRGSLDGAWVLYVALALVWSPFAGLGLMAVLGGLWGWRWAQAQRRGQAAADGGWQVKIWVRRSLTLANGAGAVAEGFFLLFLWAHFQRFSLPEIYQVTPGRLPMPLLEESHVSMAALYLVFIGVEFAGLSLALALFFRRGRGEAADSHFGETEQPLLASVTLVLLVLPCFHYGYANDLVMRGAIPALFGLQVLLVRMFLLSRKTANRPAVVPPTRRTAVILAALLLTGGLANTGIEYGRHVGRMKMQGHWRDARTREPVRTLAELQRTIYARPGFDFARQYLGSADSFFARHLARRQTPPPAGQEPAVDF